MSNSKPVDLSHNPLPSQVNASTETVLRDRFGRVHRALRISVIDACNIRCQYCMPETGVQFLKPDRLLSFDAIARFAAICVRLGVRKFRITGGEPLLRPRISELCRQLVAIDGVSDLAMTTNGLLLEEQLSELKKAGLRRLNISLDTLSDATFRQLSRRSGIDRVISGIDAAVEESGVEVKLNALVLRDVNLPDVLALVEFARKRRITLRFIEFMPLDGDRNWAQDRMVSGGELREILQENFGRLTSETSRDSSQPSSDYVFENGSRVGFIDSVTKPFCERCDRLRLTADGKIRNCLFGAEEWSVEQLLSQSGSDEQIAEVLRTSVLAKHPSHGIASPEFKPPERAMYQIGG